MRAVLYLSAVVLLAVCATWAYRVNYATQDALNRVADLRIEIAREREALGVLRAEWGYLNRPDRLRALVNENAEALGLADLTPEQFGEVTEAPFPPPPPPPAPEAAREAPDAGAAPPAGAPPGPRRAAALLQHGAIE